MSVTATRDWFFELAREEIELGSWYNPWFPEKDWTSTMYMDCSRIPDHLDGDDAGANCASFFNWIRCKMGLDPIGGTGNYNDNYWWLFWEYFNIDKNYPPFTVLVAPYGGPALEAQGHVAIVSSWEDYETRNQWLIQSDAYDWFGRTRWGVWGTPGPNEKRTMWETHHDLAAHFRWAGVIVGQWILDDFPGFEGYRGKERAMWTGDCMEQLGEEFGVTIPRFYAANMILTENTPCLDPNNEVQRYKGRSGVSDARRSRLLWARSDARALLAYALVLYGHGRVFRQSPCEACP